MLVDGLESLDGGFGGFGGFDVDDGHLNLEPL